MLNFHLAPLKFAVQAPRRLALGVALSVAAAIPVGHAQTAAQGTSAPAAPAAAPFKVALIESLSGAFANTGEAVFRNIFWAVDRVNARGGVLLPAAAGGARPLALARYDSKGQNEEALSALRAAIDDGARVVMQGNSSATAAVLIDAINKHNER
ncbi:MAG TPA: branched-chain amino acid ABC transporter substrate-binding protein, partial [Comamonadaceae bacterium]|nr:branched-chain amino acid ABC transporter substrate-binding protein [Comamonadaceae bacterium]